jgi:hypothetical protein
MSAPLKTLITSVWNHVWSAPYTMVPVAGMVMFAADGPNLLVRYAGREPGAKQLWCVRFDFKPNAMGEDIVAGYDYIARRNPSGLRPTILKKGHANITKFEGDRAMFERDLIVAKLFFPGEVVLKQI